MIIDKPSLLAIIFEIVIDSSGAIHVFDFVFDFELIIASARRFNLVLNLLPLFSRSDTFPRSVITGINDSSFNKFLNTIDCKSLLSSNDNNKKAVPWTLAEIVLNSKIGYLNCFNSVKSKIDFKVKSKSSSVMVAKFNILRWILITLIIASENCYKKMSY